MSDPVYETYPVTVESDGTATSTYVKVNGKLLNNVTAVAWEIGPKTRLIARAVMTVDVQPLKYEGPGELRPRLVPGLSRRQRLREAWRLYKS